LVSSALKFLHALQHARGVVLDVAHPPAQLEVGLVAVLAELPPHLREDVSQRLDGAVERDDLTGELVDPPSTRRRRREDLSSIWSMSSCRPSSTGP